MEPGRHGRDHPDIARFVEAFNNLPQWSLAVMAGTTLRTTGGSWVSIQPQWSPAVMAGTTNHDARSIETVSTPQWSPAVMAETTLGQDLLAFGGLEAAMEPGRDGRDHPPTS